MRGNLGRVWFGATSAAVVAGLLIQVLVAAAATGGHFTQTWARVLNVFVFFTIQSNILVGISCLALAIGIGSRSIVFWILRLTALVAISITGVVYHVALAHLLELDSWALVADQLLHTLVPVMAVAGWFVWGPRGWITVRIAWLSLVFPLCWFTFTLVRGAVSSWYPYPFVNVAGLGYGLVLVNCFWVSLLFVGLALGAWRLDGRIGDSRQTSDSQAGT